ncbi:hypothetical protein ACTVZO_14000 [Streptomyces sp. IBSNAI002]|uniref:hypothetical protein n=1 Tax=Streptomyces sp. IBSNAI002 TaxID=3457500 RepID=UPI003FD189F3
MGGMKDKRQEPGKIREEQERPQRPGQDPVHPEPGTAPRGDRRPEGMERRREEDLLRDERDDDF